MDVVTAQRCLQRLAKRPQLVATAQLTATLQLRLQGLQDKGCHVMVETEERRGARAAPRVTSRVRTHERERDHVADARAAREEHAQAIHAHAPTRRRREPDLQRLQEGIVDGLRLAVAHLPLPHLLLEAPVLLHGVRELAVRVADLHTVDEELEALGRVRAVGVSLGERRHEHGVVSDECRFDDVVRDEAVDELVHEFRRCEDRRELQTPLVEDLDKEGDALARVQLRQRWELHVETLLQRWHHAHTFERRPKVDRGHRTIRPAHLDHGRSSGLLSNAAQQVLCRPHQVLVRRVRLVELARRELGVVIVVGVLVAEDSADFENALHAADDELLQIQLWRDA
mmetsp:Transcript_13027/g.40462  ORF Transcript_13027/g.40462 Transcript_13027/m.40462 type:complete len:341 (-) Transcript_13027:520-1542(-)